MQQVRDAPREAAEGGGGAARRHGARHRPPASAPPQLLCHRAWLSLLGGWLGPGSSEAAGRQGLGWVMVDGPAKTSRGG